MKTILMSIVIYSTLFHANAFSAEKDLCLVNSDMDSDYGKMVYEMDSDNRSILHLYRDGYVNNIKNERVEMKVDDLLNGGIVLNKKDKIVTLRMYSHNFDNQRGGVLYLDTLYNGVNGERKEYEVDVAIENVNGEMRPVMYRNKVSFSKMKFIAKRHRILGIIGIDHIEFSK